MYDLFYAYSNAIADMEALLERSPKSAEKELRGIVEELVSIRNRISLGDYSDIN